MKRQKTITAELHGMEGTGPTITEAKVAAARRIQDALAGRYDPILLQRRGTALLLWRSPIYGWSVSWLTTEDGSFVRPGALNTSYSHYSHDPAELRASALMHLCQQTWRPEDGDVCPDEIEKEADREEFVGWARWQLSYARLLAEGCSRDEAHQKASKY